MLAVLASSLPMLVGYAVQTPDQRFMGTLYDRADYFTNLAKIQLGLRGEYRYRSLFTSEPVSSEPILYYYITLGAVGRLFGASATFMYEGSRLLGGLVALGLVYKFIARFIDDVSRRRLIFLLAITGSGLGWLLIGTPLFSYPQQSPMDFWLADGYLIFSIMGFSHFTWSLAALLAAFMAWLDYAEAPSWRRLLWLVAFAALLGFIQIFEIVLLDVVLALDAVRRLYAKRAFWWPYVGAGLGVGAVELVGGLPFVYALKTNPLLQLWSYQGRTLSPAPQYFLEGYGLLWLLAGVGLWLAWQRRNERLVFPALWLLGVALIVYTPNTIQYRWILGLAVPLTILAGFGFTEVVRPWLLRRLPARWQGPRAVWWLTAFMLILLMPSTLYVVAGNTFLAANHWREAFVSSGQVAAIDWLQTNVQRDDIVLADLKIGGALPGWIGQHSYFGHFAETMDFDGKQNRINQFFADMSDADRRAMLRSGNIRYVYFGPDEKSLGHFNPATVPYLILRYQSADTAIYQVQDP